MCVHALLAVHPLQYSHDYACKPFVLLAELLPPVQIGQPPADFPFQLAGYTDIAPEEFVYAKTPGGHWIAAATDPQGRLYMIDEIGDLYYDSGSPQIGLYAVCMRYVLCVKRRSLVGKCPQSALFSCVPTMWRC